MQFVQLAANFVLLLPEELFKQSKESVKADRCRSILRPSFQVYRFEPGFAGNQLANYRFNRSSEIHIELSLEGRPERIIKLAKIRASYIHLHVSGIEMIRKVEQRNADSHPFVFEKRYLEAF